MTLGLDALVLAVAAALYACGTGALGGLAARPLLQAVLTPALELGLGLGLGLG